MSQIFALKRRRDSSSNWESNDTVLLEGQLGFQTDLGEGSRPLFKFGDGVSGWNSLPFISRKNNLEALTDPTTSDDEGQYYEVGSFWCNVSAPSLPLIYICTDSASGSANWIQINSASTPPVSSVNGETGVVVLTEEDVDGTSIYNATFTGTENLDLSTFTALRAVLTGNTTLTASNTPASGESFVRSLTISSTASETLTLPVSWNVFGTYQANTNLHDIQIEFSNFPTEGLVVKAFINELT